MTDTPPHIATAIERVKEIANGANKITEAELQSLCGLAIKALQSAGYAVVPVEREFICKGCGLRIDTNEKPKEPLF